MSDDGAVKREIDATGSESPHKKIKVEADTESTAKDLAAGGDDAHAFVPPGTVGVTTINDNDVLSGRGGGTNLHPGNRQFRDLINLYRRDYLKARKNDKPAISRSIVNAIREKNGRFLKKVEKTGLWFEIGDDAAREKTSQALRQRAPEMRKLLLDHEMEGARSQQMMMGQMPGMPPGAMPPGSMPPMMLPGMNMPLMMPNGGMAFNPAMMGMPNAAMFNPAMMGMPPMGFNQAGMPQQPQQPAPGMPPAAPGAEGGEAPAEGAPGAAPGGEGGDANAPGGETAPPADGTAAAPTPNAGGVNPMIQMTAMNMAAMGQMNPATAMQMTMSPPQMPPQMAQVGGAPAPESPAAPAPVQQTTTM